MVDKAVQVAKGSKRPRQTTPSYGRNNQHEKWRYDDLVGLMVDKEMLIHWLIEEGLMAKERLCPMCDGEMSLARCEDRSDSFKWQCRRQEMSKRHKAEISIRKGGSLKKAGGLKKAK